GSNGQLTGYAWGLDKKDWLLHHEQHREQLRLF
ncbi:MAG: MGMT family protein, partial [Bacteroidia bacterium]|nr:MGMT family protein [Bacteroidia bacterium]